MLNSTNTGFEALSISKTTDFKALSSFIKDHIVPEITFEKNQVENDNNDREFENGNNDRQFENDNDGHFEDDNSDSQFENDNNDGHLRMTIMIANLRVPIVAICQFYVMFQSIHRVTGKHTGKPKKKLEI